MYDVLLAVKDTPSDVLLAVKDTPSDVLLAVKDTPSDVLLAVKDTPSDVLLAVKDTPSEALPLYYVTFVESTHDVVRSCSYSDRSSSVSMAINLKIHSSSIGNINITTLAIYLIEKFSKTTHISLALLQFTRDSSFQ